VICQLAPANVYPGDPLRFPESVTSPAPAPPNVSRSVALIGFEMTNAPEPLWVMLGVVAAPASVTKLRAFPAIVSTAVEVLFSVMLFQREGR
jgi:hypothetical protein